MGSGGDLGSWGRVIWDLGVGVVPSNRAWGQGVWAKVQGRGECGVGPRGPWPRAKPVVTSHAGGACGTQGERNIALLPVNNRQPCLESFGAIRRARNLRKPPQLVWAAAADPAARPRPRSESPRGPPPARAPRLRERERERERECPARQRCIGSSFSPCSPVPCYYMISHSPSFLLWAAARGPSGLRGHDAA